MSKVIRCKLVVGKNDPETREFIANAVADGSPENEAFFEATPCGELQFQWTKDGLLDHLGLGDEIYVDIVKVEAE